MSIVLGLTVLLVGGGLFVWLASLKAPPAERDRPEKVYNVEVFDVERSDLREIVSGFGTAEAEREVVLSAQVSGEIVELPPQVKVGRRVSAPEVRVGNQGQSERLPGDLLAAIDPRPFQERAAQARHKIAEDQAELERLRQEERNNDVLLKKVQEDYETFQAEHERILKLRARNAVTSNQVTQSLLELRKYEDALIDRRNEKALFPLRREQVERRLAGHRADLELAQLELSHTEVRPPFSGVLGEVMVERGQYVHTGDALFRLTDVSQVEVPVPLPLSDYARIEPALRDGRFPEVALAENETDAPRWTGTLVRAAPEADALTRTVKVYVHVENDGSGPPLLPGMFVHARIDGPVLRESLVVPRDALVQGRVFVAEGERVAVRTPRIERTLQSLAIIGAGVEPGERIVLTNLDAIHAGAHLHVQSHRTLDEELARQRIRVVRPVLAASGSDVPGHTVD